MNTQLEEIFKEKALKTKNEILFSQWEYDKKLLSAALEVIPVVFPHYSLHNESHSITIINNITRVLGIDALEKLSCIDIWLLLEAAYCHDLGMVITFDMRKDVFEKGQFIEHYEKISANEYHPLYEYANLFEKKADGKLYQKISEQYDNLDLFQRVPEAINFLLSDFFREKHGENVSDIIVSPYETLSIASPRIIIPHRIFRILGEICSIHNTSSFEEVKKLPFSEVGLGIENAHPRFVACMLRVGDVLDIDNNRFSETLHRTISKIPFESELHKKKHFSISHLEINQKYVDIKATCKDQSTARVVKKWFNWIREEFQNQIMLWNKIVPEEINIERLPTINNLDIDLIGFKIPQEPSFTISITKALELLQGTNFYREPFDAMREALQNSVDSMLLRFWEENKDEIQSKPNEIIDILSKHSPNKKIKVSIFDDSEECKVKIKDFGLGISLKDLNYLSNTGTSVKNIKRQSKILEMPNVLRPSGIFGIGFQSLFLLTDCITIKTKSFYTDEQYEITFHSPTSQSYQGDIYLREISKDEERVDIGAELSFKLIKSVEKHVDSDDLDTSIINALINKLKLVTMDYAELSFFPIEIDNQVNNDQRAAGNFYFNPELSTEISFHSISKNYFYKNAYVKGPYNFFRPKFVSPVCLNIHSEKANELLLLSRNEFQKNAKSKIKQLLLNSTIDYYKSKKTIDASRDILFPMFVRHYRLDEEIHNLASYLDINISNFNQNYNYETKQDAKEEEDIFVKDIINSPEIQLKIGEEIFKHFRETTYELIFLKNGKHESIAKFQSNFTQSHVDIWHFLLKELSYCKLIYITKAETDEETYIFTNKDNTKVNTIKLEQSLKKALSGNEKHIIFSDKVFIPFVSDYEKIALDAHISTDEDHYYENDHWRLMIPVSKILLPFHYINGKWKDKRNDYFYEWVHKNLSNNATLEEIKSTYNQLVNDCIKTGKPPGHFGQYEI